MNILEKRIYHKDIVLGLKSRDSIFYKSVIPNKFLEDLCTDPFRNISLSKLEDGFKVIYDNKSKKLIGMVRLVNDQLERSLIVKEGDKLNFNDNGMHSNTIINDRKTVELNNHKMILGKTSFKDEEFSELKDRLAVFLEEKNNDELRIKHRKDFVYENGLWREQPLSKINQALELFYHNLNEYLVNSIINESKSFNSLGRIKDIKIIEDNPYPGLLRAVYNDKVLDPGNAKMDIDSLIPEINLRKLF
jgi:hypothetical protein